MKRRGKPFFSYSPTHHPLPTPPQPSPSSLAHPTFFPLFMSEQWTMLSKIILSMFPAMNTARGAWAYANEYKIHAGPFNTTYKTAQTHFVPLHFTWNVLKMQKVLDVPLHLVPICVRITYFMTHPTDLSRSLSLYISNINVPSIITDIQWCPCVCSDDCVSVT